MRVILGLLTLICFLLLSVKYPLRKLGLHKLNGALMKLHEPASAGLLLAGLVLLDSDLVHLILCVRLFGQRGLLLLLSGLGVFIMCFVIIAACHMMKEPKQKMRWHRILSLITAILIAIHMAAYWM